MAIANDYLPTKVSGDDATLDFAFDYRIYETDDIIVSLINKTTDVVTAQVNGVDYDVDINVVSEGGTITFAVAPPSTHWVFIESALANLQPTTFPLDAKLREESVEKMGDRLVRLIQQVSEKVNRALVFRADTDLTGIDFTVPPPEADALIGWDAAGTTLENKPGFAATIAAVQALADAAAASAAASAASAAAALTSENNAETAETNAETAQAAAEAAQAAAETAETNAETAETNAETAETNAAASAAAALASELAAAASAAAAAASATQLTGTSVTSNLIALGAKVFTTQTGKFFGAGNFLLITSDANPANYMHGQVTSYVGTTLTMNITDIGGAGTFADWTIRLSSVAGADGANSEFTDLTDTPNSYAGAGLYKVRVNAAETGLEFTPDTGGSGGGKTFSTLLMGA